MKCQRERERERERDQKKGVVQHNNLRVMFLECSTRFIHNTHKHTLVVLVVQRVHWRVSEGDGKKLWKIKIKVCSAYLARRTGSTPTVGSSRISSCGF